MNSGHSIGKLPKGEEMATSGDALFEARTGKARRKKSKMSLETAPAPSRFESHATGRLFRADPQVYHFMAQICFWLAILFAVFARMR